MDWNLNVLPYGAVLLDAALTLTAVGSPDLSSNLFRLWGTSSPWSACSMGFPGPPFVDQPTGALSTGVPLSGGRLRYRSDLLSAHLQARLDGLPLQGYIFQSTSQATFWAPPGSTPPVLMVQYLVPAAIGPRP
jgi:hypothetical protein